MEFQVNEAVELIKVLADTENLTLQEAFKVFIAESGLDVEYAAELKGALYETYTLKEMASDSLTNALMRVFVNGESVEDIQEVSTKETAEGTKYQIRVKDAKSGSSYTRYATREKIAELRANPNISSVELTDYGDNEDRDGQKTAAAKGGGDRAKKDYDGDGKVESGSEEHAGAVHNAIQRAKGGKPDGKDTRKEEVEVEEGIDFKGARRIDDAREKAQAEKDKKNPSGKDRRLMLRKFRPGASKEERAEGGRDSMREKGTIPKKDGKKMFEQYLEIQEAKAKTREEARAKLKKNKEAIEAGKPEDSPYGAHLRKKSDPWSTHASDAKAHKKEDQQEEWRPDPVQKREKKAAKIARDEAIESGKRERDRDDAKVDKLYKRRQAVQSKTKMRKEDFVYEADLVDAGRENAGQRKKKKLTGEGVDNSTNVKLMPVVGESVVTSKKSKAFEKLKSVGESEVRDMIPDLTEKCCDKCGTPECTCGNKKEEPKKKETKLDEAGMPILEYSRNNAEGPGPEMINPPKDEDGEAGVMNPKGKPKRQKKAGETSGDRRPNNGGPDLPDEMGTVPSGCGC